MLKYFTSGESHGEALLAFLSGLPSGLEIPLDFVNRVGEVAEQQGHHPDILLAWGKAEITLWTHKIDGLTQSDFIMAAKIDQLLK